MTIPPENKSTKSDTINNNNNEDYLNNLKTIIADSSKSITSDTKSDTKSATKSDTINNNEDYLNNLKNTVSDSLPNLSSDKEKSLKSTSITSLNKVESQKPVQLDKIDKIPEIKSPNIDNNSFTPFSILKLGDSKSKPKQSRGVFTYKSDIDVNPNTEIKDTSINLKQQVDPKKDTFGEITKGITKGFSDLFKDISTSTSDATSAVKRNMKLTPSTSKESETPAKSEKSTTSLKSIRSSKSTKSLDSKNILKATDSAIKMTGIFSFFSWKVIGIIIAVIIILLLIINFIFSGSKLNIVQEIIKLVGNLISLIANFGKDSSVDIISDSADIIDDTIDSVDTAVGIKGTQRNMINNDSNPSNENIAVGSNTFNIKPDDMDSSTQKAKHVKSASYCYIGEDRGFRSCLQVEKGDKCMSGDIFPSKELCINPNLRQ